VSTLASARRASTIALAGLPIPEAFAVATSASVARILAKPTNERTAANIRDMKRLARNERSIAERTSR
jgi:hypothetical protein